MKKSDLQGYTINDQYVVGPSLGAGAFGEVYIVFDIKEEKILALKKEEEKIKIPQLINDYRILKMLNGFSGFPRVHYYGFQLHSNVCVMDLLGPSLQDLFQTCGGVFSLKTVLMLAEQIIDRIQVIHSKNYLYRDIKPENFLMGLEKNSNKLYLIDFGLSKRFKDPKNDQHILYKQKKSIVGTLRYASVNSHLGIEYSRRDDLQAIGYMLIYLATGGLPWMGLAADNKNKRADKILEIKLQTPPETYTEGLPSEFCIYLNYCKSLKFSERPDYGFLKKLFSDLFANIGYVKDYEYDWCRQEKNDYKNSKLMIELNKNIAQPSESDDDSVHNIFGRKASDQITEEQIKLGIESNSRYRKSNESRNSKTSNESMRYNEGDENIDPDLLEDSQIRLISKRSRWFQSML